MSKGTSGIAVPSTANSRIESIPQLIVSPPKVSYFWNFCSGMAMHASPDDDRPAPTAEHF